MEDNYMRITSREEGRRGEGSRMKEEGKTMAEEGRRRE